MSNSWTVINNRVRVAVLETNFLATERRDICPPVIPVNTLFCGFCRKFQKKPISAILPQETLGWPNSSARDVSGVSEEVAYINQLRGKAQALFRLSLWKNCR